LSVSCVDACSGTGGGFLGELAMPTSAVHTGLSLSILGAPEFTGEGAGNASGISEQPMRLALLVYLAASLPRGFRRRDELLALLWPDSDDHRARNSLRQSLHVLRQRLPADTVLVRGSEEVALSPHQLRLDSEMFEEHLDHGREVEALALYRGDLLQGCHLADCPGFEEWLSAERERLRRRAVHGALVLAKRCEWDGDAPNATRWAGFAEARAPLDEDVLHDVVGLLERLGDRGGAAQRYAAGVERFRSQLGITLTPFGERESQGAPGRNAQKGLVLTGRTGATGTGPRSAAGHVPFVPPRARSVSVDARRLYLEARQYLSQRSPATIERAIEAFTGALRLAPDYAEAHAGISFALGAATVYVGYPGIDAWPRVRTHASRAIRLDPSLGEAHALLAVATLCHDYDWTSAERMFRVALELDPVSDILRVSFAHYFLTGAGRIDEALDVLNRLRDIMPSAPGVSYMYAMSCVYGRRYERARDEAATVLEAQPGFGLAYWVLGMAHEGLGDLDAAISTFETGLACTNGSSLLLTQIGRACASAGDHARARQILAELEGRGEQAGPAAYFTAEILAALGDMDPAIDSLYASYRQRNPMMVFAGVLPGLDPLRERRRFRELLMRMGIRAHERDSMPSPVLASARNQAG
jgi:DNA-binding SARP family transcriptional activator